MSRAQEIRVKKLCHKARQIIGIKKDDDVTVEMLDGLDDEANAELNVIHRELSRVLINLERQRDGK